MKLLIGLGNPGAKYENNRHNIGFMVVDHLAQIQNSKFKIQNYSSKFKIEQTKIQIGDEKALLAKPQSYMNLSGEAVAKIISYWKFDIGDLIVIHDDLDIPLGDFKIQKGVGPKNHNGILSVERALGTSDFWRVRIGIDNRANGEAGLRMVPGERYVLQDFTSEERVIVNSLFPKICNRLNTLFKLFH